MNGEEEESWGEEGVDGIFGNVDEEKGKHARNPSQRR